METGVTDDARVMAMMPVGLSEVQKVVIARLTEQNIPESQAQLVDLGRSRASVHSAISVLRKGNPEPEWLNWPPSKRPDQVNVDYHGWILE